MVYVQFNLIYVEFLTIKIISMCFDEKHTVVARKKKLPLTGRNFEQDRLADLQARTDKEGRNLWEPRFITG